MRVARMEKIGGIKLFLKTYLLAHFSIRYGGAKTGGQPVPRPGTGQPLRLYENIISLNLHNIMPSKPTAVRTTPEI